jgi:hypothetical protein
MSEATPRFRLPFIIPGQAQKEMFHNEALLRLDMALQAAVESAALFLPPENPGEGQCWIVAAPAGGAWAGKEGQLAMWSASGWRFVDAVEGAVVWDKAGAVELRRTASGWSVGEARCTALFVNGQKVVGTRAPAVPSPSGGTTIDEEARAAVNSLIATLMSHGLIE